MSMDKPLRHPRRRGLGLLGTTLGPVSFRPGVVLSPDRYEIQLEPEGAAPKDKVTEQLEHLRTLGELRRTGVLNDEEFEREKARILG